MLRSLEFYFLFNFTADVLLIAVVARANGCMSARQILPAGLFSAVYALASATVSPKLNHPLIQATLLAPVSMLIADDPHPRAWRRIAFHLACGAALLGGIALLSAEQPVPVQLGAYAAGLALLGALLTQRTYSLEPWEVTVCLRLHGRSVRFQALIDTGNRLREPMSGLPVLIAESSLLEDLIRDADGLPSRSVAFGGLGGGGTVRCFRPDEILIRRRERMVRAPAAWVAVYPGRIPGPARALAPPSFAVIPGMA